MVEADSAATGVAGIFQRGGSLATLWNRKKEGIAGGPLAGKCLNLEGRASNALENRTLPLATPLSGGGGGRG